MQEDSTTTSNALDLMMDLLDLDGPDIEARLAAVPDALAQEVRALLSVDRDRPELQPEDLAATLCDGVEPWQASDFRPEGFEVLEQIGRGGMGTVYRAMQNSPRRVVALKLVDGDGAAEAQALSDADHPVIPRIHLVESIGPVSYLAMEFIDGEPLQHWAGRATLDERLRVFESICRGIHQIHERGILHRDLKPANILVGPNGPRLVDFGLAVGIATENAPVAGTLAYIAKEVLAGEPASVRSDVYALGCILRDLIDSGDVPPPAVLESVFCAALAPYAERYESAADLADDVARYRAGHVPRRHPGHLVDHVRFATWRHRVPLTLVAIALLLAGGVVLGRSMRESWRQEAAAAALARIERLPDEALRDQLTRFVGLPDYQDTDAVDRARLTLAGALGADGDFESRTNQLALVFARGGPLRSEAAEALATYFHDTRQWESMRAIAPVVAEPRATTLATSARVALRDWEDRRGLPPMIQRLADARHTDLRADRLWHDGERFLSLAWDAPPTMGSLQGLTHDVLARPPLRGARLPMVVDTDGPLVISQSDGRLRLQRPEADEWVDVADLPFAGQAWSVAAGDLNGDGVPSLFIGTAPDPRSLTVLEPPDWRPRVANVDLDNTASDVEELLVADLDGDGRDELVVHLGPWRSHDVRIYRQNAAGTLDLLARERFGGLADIGVLTLPSGERRLLVMKADQYPNAPLYGASTPMGRPAGLYVYAFDGHELHQTSHQPIEDLVLPWSGLLTGDLDGDGDTDIVAAGHEELLLLELDEHAEVRQLHRVHGMRAIAIADVDDDPADEVLTKVDGGDRLWVLGSGSQAVPSLASPLRTGHSELESLGLHATAGRLNATKAWLEDDPERRASMFLHSARLLRTADQVEESLAMVRSALEAYPLSEAAELRDELLLRLGRFVETGVPVFELQGAQLPPSRPTATTLTSDGDVRIRASTGDGLLVTLPLRRTSDMLGMEISFTVHSAEAGANLHIEMVEDEVPILGVKLTPWGGALRVERQLQCVAQGRRRDLDDNAAPWIPVDQSSQHEARLGVVDGELVCAFSFDERQILEHHAHPIALPEQLSLEVRMAGPSPGATLDVTLDSVTLLGARPLDLERAPSPPTLLESLEVEARLGTLGHDELPLDRLDRSALIAAVRRQPAPWLGALRRHHPEVLASLVPEAWTIALQSGSGPGVAGDLERAWLDHLAPDSWLAARYQLLRATHLVRIGASERARRLLVRLTEEVPVELRAEAWLDLARLEMRDGEVESGREACASAERVSVVPFLVRDTIEVDPLLSVCLR